MRIIILTFVLAATAVQASPLQHATNRHLAAAVLRYRTPAVVTTPSPAPAASPRPVVTRSSAPKSSNGGGIYSRLYGRKPSTWQKVKAALSAPAAGVPATHAPVPCAYGATVWPNIYATTDRGGIVSTGRYTKPRDAYVALPAYGLRNRTVYVRCRCPQHRDGGFVPFRVLDTGPWSVMDNFVDEKRRPAVERGYSDTYKRVPKTAPGIDLSIGAWHKLGHNIGFGPAADNYSGRIDLLSITSVVPMSTEAKAE